MARRDFEDRWTYNKKPRPTIGCADVTIVSITAIAAFVILILILVRPDFAAIFERLPVGNTATTTPAAVRTTITPTVPTVQSALLAPTTAALVPVASPTAVVTPTATPPPLKRVKTIESCNLRPEPRVGSQSKGVMPIGTTFKLLGETRETREAKWQSVEQEDNPNNRGWMWEICFDMKNQF
jgi:hypothetical protein